MSVHFKGGYELCNLRLLSSYLNGTLNRVDDMLEFFDHAGRCDRCRAAISEFRRNKEAAMTNKERVIEYLKQHPGSLAKEVCANTGIKSGSVSGQLSVLQAGGHVIGRLGDDGILRYSLPGSEPAQTPDPSAFVPAPKPEELPCAEDPHTGRGRLIRAVEYAPDPAIQNPRSEKIRSLLAKVAQLEQENRALRAEIEEIERLLDGAA